MAKKMTKEYDPIDYYCCMNCISYNGGCEKGIEVDNRITKHCTQIRLIKNPKKITEYHDKKRIEDKKDKKKKEEEKIIFKSFIEDDELLIEQVYDGTPKFCMYFKKSGKIDYATELFIHNNKHRPINDEEVIKGAVGLPTKAEEYGTDDELDNEICDFINQWLDIPDDYLKFALWNIKRSWVYQKFHTLNYLRALGDTGEGKSRFLDTLGYLHYKPTQTSGASTSAPVFRLIDKWKGTLIMDEADFSKSDESQDMIKIINQGYEKGKFIMRCDQNDASKLAFFDPFCPKLIATRKTFEDKAVESRCITNIMDGTDRQDIPLNLNEDFFRGVIKLRNKLLMWRFRNYDKIEMSNEIPDLGVLEPRIKQVVISLIPLFQKDEKKMQELKTFIEKQQEKLIIERSESFDGQIVEAIYNLMQDGMIDINAKDIIEKGNIVDKYGKYVHSRTISHHLKGLGFGNSVMKKVYGTVKRCIPLNQRFLEKLFNKYGIKKGNEVTQVTMYTETPEFLKKKEKDEKVTKGGVTTCIVTSDTCVTDEIEIFDKTVEDFGRFAETNKTDNYDKAEQIFGKDMIQNWLKNGDIFEIKSGTLSPLK